MFPSVQPVNAQMDSPPATDNRGWLGVIILNVSSEAARALQMQRRQGVIVLEVTPGGAAEQAGLHQGDVILSFNGEAIDQSGELPRLIAQHQAGADVTLEIWRAGEAHSMPVRLGARPSEPPRIGAATGQAPATADSAASANGKALGLVVRVLAPAEAQARGVAFGLVIERIGAAAKAPQLAPGDVIVGINNDEFSSVAEFNALVAKHAPGSSVALRVRRGLEERYVPVKVQG
jgi:serine protease Do